MVALLDMCWESQFGPTYVVFVPRTEGYFVQFGMGPQWLITTVAGKIEIPSMSVIQFC